MRDSFTETRNVCVWVCVRVRERGRGRRREEWRAKDVKEDSER